MSRRDLISIATVMAAVACTTALVSLAGAQAIPTSHWVGSVTCTITTTSTDPNVSYTDQQTHTWSIWPFLISTQGAFTYYSDVWTVTGSGSKSDGSTIRLGWKTDGKGYGFFKFWVLGTDLHIQKGNSQLEDHSGILVTQTDSGTNPPTVTVYPASVWEQDFGTIIVPATTTHVVDSSTPTISGSVGYQQPGKSAHTDVCSWNLQYGPVLLQPPPGGIHLERPK
jgi:hypothetical protein